MALVEAIPVRPGSLPDMSVVEIAIIVALLRRGPAPVDALAPMLADWFAQPVRSPDIAPSVGRMTGRGWLARRGERLEPTPAAYAPTQLLYAGFIRLLGRDTDASSDDGQLSLLADTGKGRDI